MKSRPAFLFVKRRLLVSEGEALEGNDLRIFVGCFESFLNRDVVVCHLAGLDGAFCSLAVCALSGDHLSLLTDDAYCLVEVTMSFPTAWQNEPLWK